jgi:hypothetical protein
MSDQGHSAPSWLFSFVDLAFLLLIAMTQIAEPGALDLGEIDVPSLDAKASEEVSSAARELWQVRVHPRSAPEDEVFELRAVSSVASDDAAAKLTLAALTAKLGELKSAGAEKPLLAPHAESRSQDLLDAVAAIEDRWPGNRRTLVSRLAAAP